MSKRKPKDGPRANPGEPGGPVAAASSLADRSVIDLILDIKERRTDPRNLHPEDRRACVAHLGAEGLSVAETAQFLACSDRTIFRDRVALQEAAALSHDPALAGRVAGQIFAQANTSMERILRLARDRAIEPGVRLEAYRTCFLIFGESVKLVQSLGYLPSAVRQLDARLIHAVEQVPDTQQLRAELERLREIGRQEGGASIAQLQSVEALSIRAEIAATLESGLQAQTQDREP